MWIGTERNQGLPLRRSVAKRNDGERGVLGEAAQGKQKSDLQIEGQIKFRRASSYFINFMNLMDFTDY